MGEQAGTAECIERLAQWLWQSDEGDSEPLRWLACAAGWVEQSGMKRMPFEEAQHERIKADMKSSMDEEQFSQVWSTGATLSLEEALEELLPKYMDAW